MTSSTTDLPEPDTAAALARAGWNRVLDRILQGMGHDLNNRVQSLMSLVQLAQIDEDSSSLSPFLEKEVDHLEQVVRLLRLIPGHPGEAPELIHLPEILEPLLELSRIQRYLEIVERSLTVKPEGLMPVRARWSFLSRTLILFLSAAAWEAETRSRHLAVTLSAETRPDGNVCRIVAVATGARSNREDAPPSAARPEGLHEVAGLLGGSFEAERDETEARLVLRIPMVSRPVRG